jgi:hypothetical protein
LVQLAATATAKALAEGRTSTVTSNIPEVLDCARRLAAHLGAVAEVTERGDMVEHHHFERRKTQMGTALNITSPKLVKNGGGTVLVVSVITHQPRSMTVRRPALPPSKIRWHRSRLLSAPIKSISPASSASS